MNIWKRTCAYMCIYCVSRVCRSCSLQYLESSISRSTSRKTFLFPDESRSRVNHASTKLAVGKLATSRLPLCVRHYRSSSKRTEGGIVPLLVAQRRRSSGPRAVYPMRKVSSICVSVALFPSTIESATLVTHEFQFAIADAVDRQKRKRREK